MKRILAKGTARTIITTTPHATSIPTSIMIPEEVNSPWGHIAKMQLVPNLRVWSSTRFLEEDTPPGNDHPIFKLKISTNELLATRRR